VVRVTGLFVVAMAVASGCVRDPAGECTSMDPGDVIVTEFRGEQNPAGFGDVWVELYNTSPKSLDLEGTKIRFRKKDGSSEVPILVRRSIVMAPSSYVVLGLVADDENKPTYVDYGFGGDFDMDYLSAAAVDIEVCGERIDRAVYDSLPKTGTYQFGGALDSDSNDIPTMWCVNPASAGTPKMANPTCPIP